MRRLAQTLTAALVPLVVLATVLGVLVPDPTVAARSDLILAVLVVITALGIDARQLAGLRRRLRALAALSVGPFVALGAVAWALSQAFSGATRDGVLCLGLSSTEVAMVGLVALAGADATLALGALAGSLVVSAVAGPAVTAALGATATLTSTLTLLGQFALIVLAPLAGGLVTRAAIPALHRATDELAAASAITVALLVYTALSGATGQLGQPAVGAAAFLALGLLAAIAWERLASPTVRIAGAFAAGGRDFAVAAVLATQAYGTAAGAVGGLYGAMVLIAGSIAASALKRRSQTTRRAHRRDGAHLCSPTATNIKRWISRS